MFWKRKTDAEEEVRKQIASATMKPHEVEKKREE